MMRMISCLLTVVLLWLACKPARSDIYMETVNAVLLNNLVAKADSVVDMVADSGMLAANPMLVTGKVLFSKQDTKTSRLWFDEQNRPAALIEFEKGTLKDSMLFYPNGQRMFTLLFDRDGKPSGPARYYHADGRVRLDGRFENGVQTGIWREFDEDGRLLVTHEYDRYGMKKR
ncbi:MAG TPA: hypothetical protein VK907_07640 [Phnomibacter sp.]|nr:hypothetical protein [Phnomibacter sp.]